MLNHDCSSAVPPGRHPVEFAGPGRWAREGQDFSLRVERAVLIPGDRPRCEAESLDQHALPGVAITHFSLGANPELCVTVIEPSVADLLWLVAGRHGGRPTDARPFTEADKDLALTLAHGKTHSATLLGLQALPTGRQVRVELYAPLLRELTEGAPGLWNLTFECLPDFSQIALSPLLVLGGRLSLELDPAVEEPL